MLRPHNTGNQSGSPLSAANPNKVFDLFLPFSTLHDSIEVFCFAMPGTHSSCASRICLSSISMTARGRKGLTASVSTLMDPVFSGARKYWIIAAALIPCYWIMSGHQAADTAAMIANARIDLISDAVNVLPTIVAGIEGAGGLRPCTPGIGPGPMHSPANSGPGYS